MHDVWKQFEENNITHSAAHHLLAIMELKAARGYARVTDVAAEDFKGDVPEGFQQRDDA